MVCWASWWKPIFWGSRSKRSPRHCMMSPPRMVYTNTKTLPMRPASLLH
jgi:hypothetical protein